MGPGLVDGDPDPAQQIGRLLVLARRDVGGGDLAGVLRGAGAPHVRGAVVDQQVVVLGTGQRQVRGVELGVGQLEFVPAVLRLAVSGLAALPGLVPPGEVQDRGGVGDREVAAEAPLDEVVAGVELDEVTVEHGVEDALVVLVELVRAGPPHLVEPRAERVAQILALDDQQSAVELVLTVEELRYGGQSVAQSEQFTEIVEDDHVGVQGDHGVVVADPEDVEDEVGLAHQVVVLVALGVRVVVPGVDAAEVDAWVQGPDLCDGGGAQSVVQDEEVLADVRVGQGQAAQQGEEAGQVVLVDEAREGDPALAGERVRGRGRGGWSGKRRGGRRHRSRILMSVTLWARSMTHAFSLVYSCTEVMGIRIAPGRR
ncbi:hypothetical protein ACVWZD_002922 [Streptomyces sp. TE3672]